MNTNCWTVVTFLSDGDQYFRTPQGIEQNTQKGRRFCRKSSFNYLTIADPETAVVEAGLFFFFFRDFRLNKGVC